MTERCSVVSCQSIGELRCARCKLASYCSKECQKEDWRVHKATCSSVTKAAAEGELKNCTCMFCGQRVVCRSEADAMAHMEACANLQEQLQDPAQFTIPQALQEELKQGAP